MKTIYEHILEDILDRFSLRYGIVYQKEYRFHNEYQYRFDYAIPEKKVAIEIEGGIYVFGRHNMPIGYTEDIIKYNLAQSLGWKVYRFTTEQVKKRLFIYPTKHKPKRKIKTLEGFLYEVIVAS